MTIRKPKTKTPKDGYHTSAPPIPEGLTPMNEWAKSKGLTPVCVQRWIYAGKLQSYRIPGYGTRNFIKAADAERVLKPQPLGPSLAR